MDIARVICSLSSLSDDPYCNLSAIKNFDFVVAFGSALSAIVPMSMDDERPLLPEEWYLCFVLGVSVRFVTFF